MRLLVLKLVAVAVLLAAGLPLRAAMVIIDSGPGLPTSIDDRLTVAITRHDLWQANHPVNPGDPLDHSAIWVSFAHTGYGDSEFVPFGGGTPVASVFHYFNSGAGMLYLDVWADDTAGVLLDGVYLALPVLAQATCSGAPIGCLPEHVGHLSAPLTKGAHVLQFDMYQTGTGLDTRGNPLGLLYTGAAPAPEPVTFLLFGSGLIATAMVGRRKTRR